MSQAILVTGASGFVGRAVVERLAPCTRVLAASRSAFPCPPGAEWIPSPDLVAPDAWRAGFPRVHTVIHLAALAHVPAGGSTAFREQVFETNARMPVRLARCAAAAGVRRFVFVSSVKALGESSLHPLVPDTTPRPGDVYGEAKLAAEQGLAGVAAECGLELVVVRPPLVYGPGVKANFLELARWASKGIPLPLASVRNRRSVVAAGNLADLLARAAVDARAVGRTLHVTDGTSLSTPALIRAIARAGGRPVRLFPVPPRLLWAALSVSGHMEIAHRLLGSLELDDSDTRALLDWSPPLTTDQAIAAFVRSIA